MQHLSYFVHKKPIRHTYAEKRPFGRRTFCASSTNFKIGVVGSGPAGFYATESILKRLPLAKVDLYEKLPTPFGLVRFGVAPDHPEVKLVTNKFEQLASDPRCRFIGNVNVGTDISINDLIKHYHAIVLAYGASSDRALSIPGEDLPEFDLKRAKDVVIVGHGNVALDVARILLRPTTELQDTDIAHHAFEVLTHTNIQRVHLLGRRGPAQASFTTKELREMLTLSNCKTYVARSELQLDPSSEAEIKKERGRKRLVELLQKAQIIDDWNQPHVPNEKAAFVRFYCNPVSFVGKTHVTSVNVERTKLEGPPEKQKAVGTGVISAIPCDLVFKSVGYKSVPLEDVPFDKITGIIQNEKGKVTSNNGLYVCGWVKRGPSGIIGTNKFDAEETVDVMVQDLMSKQKLHPHFDSVSSDDAHASDQIIPILKSKGIIPVSFDDWKKLDQIEQDRGSKRGKPREKITDVSEMVRLLSQKDNAV